MKINYLLSIAIIGIALGSCKKDDTTPTEEEVSNAQITAGISLNVNYAIYSDLSLKSINLYNAVATFIASPNANGLTDCRNFWKGARAAWEQSEGFLYGPVATENIDPRIDSWPVDFNAIDALLAGSTDFTVEANIDALDDALKGFHPIEYVLWGETGNKTFSEFTAREKEYLLALANNLKNLTAQLEQQWNTTSANPYVDHFTSPGASNPYYATNKAVFEEMVNALIGICEEVAEGKIGEPFTLQDPSLEESPYSSNSIADFTNNMKSVQNVYLGKYSADGHGIEDLVRKHNLSLDNTIKTKINAAIASLGAVTDPFGTAISSQQPQVQNTIDAIEDLKNTLETDLLPFVQQHVTD